MANMTGHFVEIEDLRQHATQTLIALEELLLTGASVTPDPKRPGFYEIEGEDLVYYVCDSLAPGKLILLATWPKFGLHKCAGGNA